MSIDIEHIALHREALDIVRWKIGGGQFLIAGHQKIRPECQAASRKEFGFDAVRTMFRQWGGTGGDIDLFDEDATFQSDLGVRQVWEQGKCDLVYDIGTIEHVADSCMVLENYIAWLKVGGLLFLLTPVKGFYNHGLHTFSPEFILGTLEANGCRIVKQWWLDRFGPILESQDDAAEVLIVVIAEKVEPFERPLKHVAQERWKV